MMTYPQITGINNIQSNITIENNKTTGFSQEEIPKDWGGVSSTTSGLWIKIDKLDMHFIPIVTFVEFHLEFRGRILESNHSGSKYNKWLWL